MSFVNPHSNSASHTTPEPVKPVSSAPKNVAPAEDVWGGRAATVIFGVTGLTVILFIMFLMSVPLLSEILPSNASATSNSSLFETVTELARTGLNLIYGFSGLLVFVHLLGLLFSLIGLANHYDSSGVIRRKSTSALMMFWSLAFLILAAVTISRVYSYMSGADSILWN